jgi:hypothetical protein
MAIVLLSRCPEPAVYPFFFRLRDEVQTRNQRQSGRIVEGRYDGPDPPGGAYDVTYEIETETGPYFRARQIDLELTRGQVRARINERVKAGLCECDIPVFGPTGPGEPAPVASGPAARGPCYACGERNPVLRWGNYGFHEECFALWQEVCRELRDTI